MDDRCNFFVLFVTRGRLYHKKALCNRKVLNFYFLYKKIQLDGNANQLNFENFLKKSNAMPRAMPNAHARNPARYAPFP